MSHDKPSTYLVFGAWVHGGCYGVTKRTQKPGCASTSMSLSADHRLKPLLGHLLYSTSMAKPDSTQTSTTKKSRTTARSPSVITQGRRFGSKVQASWVQRRCSRTVTANNTKDTTALRTASRHCCIPRQNTVYNPTKANDILSALIRQGVPKVQ